MNHTEIISLLKMSGLEKVGFSTDGNFILFQDPACILPAFDLILHYAWIVIMVLIGIMLFSWGILYIMNGIKLESAFHNAKSLVLVLAILALVKPIVNFVYGDDLFAKQCDTKQVALANVQELIKQREKYFENNEINQQYEIFDVIDSGVTNNNLASIE